MLLYALSPKAAFAPFGRHLQICNPICAGQGLGASDLWRQALQSTHRSGATPLANVGGILAEQAQPKNQNDEILVPKKKGPPLVQLVAQWMKRRERHTAEYIGGYMAPEDMPGPPGYNYPEVCFAGRSNVGKSSALNRLVGGKNAITSKTPGRTRRIDLFKIGKVCSITDLPGYGFAKINSEMQQKWNSGITAYLRHRENLKAVVLLVDARREPQELDARFLDFLEEENVPTLVLATKIDKISDVTRQKVLHRLYASLALPEGQPIPFSSVTGEGKKEAWKALAKMCLAERPAKKESDEQGVVPVELWR